MRFIALTSGAGPKQERYINLATKAEGVGVPGRPERGCEVKTLTKPRGAQEMQLIVWMLSAIKASGIDEHQKRRKRRKTYVG